MDGADARTIRGQGLEHQLYTRQFGPEASRGAHTQGIRSRRQGTGADELIQLHHTVVGFIGTWGSRAAPGGGRPGGDDLAAVRKPLGIFKVGSSLNAVGTSGR